MKITNEQLRQIIKEELNKVLSEAMREPYGSSAKDMSSLYQIAAKVAQREGMEYLYLFADENAEYTVDGVGPFIKYVNKAKDDVPELSSVKYTELVDYLKRNELINDDQESGGFSIDQVTAE